MDAETIQALAQLPVMAVLIYLLVRAQTQNEKLLLAMIESERQHARNLVDIVCSGKITIIPETGKYAPVKTDYVK